MTAETSLFAKFKETGKHGIIFGLGSTLHAAISFLLIPVYTTHLLTSEYGILGLITITGSILTTIFALGVNFGLFRSYYEYDDAEERREVISTAFFLIVINCIVLFIFGLFFSKYLSILIFGNTVYEIYFLIITIISAFTILNSIPFVIFRVRKKSIQYVTFQISFFIIGIISIIYLVVVKDWGVLGVLVGNLIMGTVSCLTLYFYIRKEIVLKFLKHEAKKMLQYGLPLIPANLSAFVFNSCDRYFLNYYSTLHEVGLYTLGYSFGMIITVLFASPLAMIWPAMFLSVKDHSNARAFYSRALTFTIFIGSFLLLAISLLSKEVLHIFADKAYWGAYTVIPIIALTYTIWALPKILNVAMSLKRKTQASAIIYLLGAIINIGLNFAWIPKYGMIGAAYATLATFVIIVAMLFFYNQRLMEVKYEWNRISKIGMVVTVIFLTGYLVTFNDLYTSIAFKVGIILLYPLILYPLRFYSADEIQRMKQIFVYILIKLKLKQTSNGM